VISKKAEDQCLASKQQQPGTAPVFRLLSSFGVFLLAGH
jgi:hypothetical protein